MYFAKFFDLREHFGLLPREEAVLWGRNFKKIMDYEAVIGLEVHVQLKTASKAFSRSAWHYGAEPNTLTDSVVLGLPGALPVINEMAIQQTIRAGLMFNCRIAEVCKWDRKNYFYPDSPKNYQISQQDQPLCIGGEVEIELPGSARNVMGSHRMVKLNRIHLEEDVGKLTHFATTSLVDFNRAGTPLAEIVSEPDMHSADEASAYLTALKMNLEQAEISDCDMEKGQMRCDANVSIRPVGRRELGTRVELKNLNSISGVRNGIQYEICRQAEILDAGGQIHQETRRWDASRNVSESMRQKEGVSDYCYFPDPDLMPVRPSPAMIERLRESLPERPFDRQRRLMERYELPYSITSVLCPSGELCLFFEEAAAIYSNGKAIANLLVNDLLREMGARGENRHDFRFPPADFAQLVCWIDRQKISKQAAQNALVEAYGAREPLLETLEKLGALQHQNDDELESVCRRVMDENPKPVGEFRAGKINAINALKGRVMGETQGKANPAQVDGILRRLLKN